MKILLATSKGIPAGGGIASYNQELVNLLGKKNDIYLLTDADEINVEGYLETFSTIGNSNTDFIYCKKLIENINNADYDCIINSNSNFIPVISPFLQSNIVSVSHFVKGILAVNAGYNAEYQSGIIALSQYGKKFIIKKFKIADSDKVEVIYNFVETRPEVGYFDKIGNQPIRIVYPGGTSIEKSVDVIQNLMYKLLGSDLNFEFYWLGGTRLPSASLSLLGLHDIKDIIPADSRVKIMGKVSRSKAMKIIETANVFLLPSRGEGCPMTLLEAMRSGCIPIVSDAKHGSREIIENSGAGFIVKQNSSQCLLRVIKEIINNPSKYNFIYSKSSQYLRDSLSQEIWATKMESLLNKARHNEKISTSLTYFKFKSSAIRFNIYNKIERLKIICKSAFYRIKFDLSYMKFRLDQ